MHFTEVKIYVRKCNFIFLPSASMACAEIYPGFPPSFLLGKHSVSSRNGGGGGGGGGGGHMSGIFTTASPPLLFPYLI